jgi:N-methylhydantoinase A
VVPTISDANLLLGRLDPAKLKSVEGGVSLADIERIFEDSLGKPLGLDAVGAAEAVVRLANIKMAGAVRMVSVSLGHDPRDFALFAFGGAGPLHASALARELGVPRVLVPARPGITNALGCTIADFRHDFVSTLNTPLDRLEPARLAEVLRAQAAEGEALIAKERAQVSEVLRLFSVDMQFAGQTHILRVPLDSPDISRTDLQTRFEEVYHRRFRVRLPEIRAAVVNANTSVIGRRAEVDLGRLIDPAGRKTNTGDAQTGTRKVRFDGAWHETPIYWRDHLPADVILTGPAIIEQMDTTILLEPGDTAQGITDGNLLITLAGAA